MDLNSNFNDVSKEVFIEPDKVIMSKTNSKGVIQYANDYFIEISSYTTNDLLGKPHNIVRHPDMPKVIFKIMWKKLHKGENLYTIVKNLTKEGNFYWVVTSFETTFKPNGEILAHYARRKAIPQKVKDTAESIYSIILKIEKHDPELAEITFHEILKDYNLTYDDFFLELSGMSSDEVIHYFQSKELNTNTNIENTVLEIEQNTKQFEAFVKVKGKKIARTDFEEIRAEIKLLSKKLNDDSIETPIDKGFLGDIPELNKLSSLIKKKNSVQ